MKLKFEEEESNKLCWLHVLELKRPHSSQFFERLGMKEQLLRLTLKYETRTFQQLLFQSQRLIHVMQTESTSKSRKHLKPALP